MISWLIKEMSKWFSCPVVIVKDQKFWQPFFSDHRQCLSIFEIGEGLPPAVSSQSNNNSSFSISSLPMRWGYLSSCWFRSLFPFRSHINPPLLSWDGGSLHLLYSPFFQNHSTHDEEVDDDDDDNDDRGRCWRTWNWKKS